MFFFVCFFANIVFHYIFIRMYIHVLLVLKFDNIIVNVTLKQTLRYETQTIHIDFFSYCSIQFLHRSSMYLLTKT